MIKIIAVGKIKHKYLIEGIDDYLTRISKYTKIKVLELADSNIGQEGKLILNNIEKKEYVIILDVVAKQLTSIDFSNYLDNLYTSSISNITFVIGGSTGIDPSVKDRANYSISFSKMTFPHQLFRMLLLEQLYRSYKILNNETYHK